jgi:CubicO group peptidase (beta-lactamase class C family)
VAAQTGCDALIAQYKIPTTSQRHHMTPHTSTIDTHKLQPLFDLIQSHIDDHKYPGCQIAIAREGQCLVNRSFGLARMGRGHEADTKALPANNDHLFLLYSNTKVLVATALWKLYEDGKFAFTDRVADHLSGFAVNGKQDISLLQLITHQAGFPDAEVPASAWHDHAQVLQAVCGFSLQWPPGSRVHYHGLSAHWVLAMVIEAITGQDFREAITRWVLQPLGLQNDLFMGLPAKQQHRLAFLYEPDAAQPSGQRLRDESTNTTWQTAGVPGGGAYGTARGMALLYQMMLQGGRLNGVQLLSPATLAYAIQNHTADRVDEFMGMPMHRGLGPHLRGHTASIRGLGSDAPPNAFGHGGVGTSYCWADPNSGVSFAYLTNSRVPEPWHSQRLNDISNAVYAAIT